jgi:hypothetical protein
MVMQCALFLSIFITAMSSQRRSFASRELLIAENYREAALTHHRRQINRNFFVLENKTHDAKDGTEEASAIPRTCDRSVRLLLLIQCNLR